MTSLRLPAIFSDNALLQADASVALWGWAHPAEAITVDFLNSGVVQQTLETVSNAEGRWSVSGLRQPCGTSGELRISSASGEVRNIQNVLFGELWLASGQSNIQQKIKELPHLSDLEKDADHPDIRYFRVKANARHELQEEAPGVWEVCSPESLPKFSAIPYLFALARKAQNRGPVGIIRSTVGGSPIESWLPLKALAQLPEQKKTVTACEKQRATLTSEQLAAKVVVKETGHQPTTLYNGMIHPLAGCTLKGILWYQGESNVGQATAYAKSFCALIQSWREAWQVESLPFVYVELAGYGPRESEPAKRKAPWAELRQAQSAALGLELVACVTAVDVGLETDIHTTDKQTVAERLVKAARGFIDGEPGDWLSPRYLSHAVEDGQVRLRFSGAEAGLNTHDGLPPKTFMMKSRWGGWKAASATVEGDSILVSYGAIKVPVALRYGWADNPAVNVYNAKQLPLMPFEIALT